VHLPYISPINISPVSPLYLPCISPGDIYSGEWKAGKKHGEGTYFAKLTSTTLKGAYMEVRGGGRGVGVRPRARPA
jgi:hypothetical protein